jgi:hypothetical protein
MIGNSYTFTHSKKGKELWGKLLRMLRDAKHVYEGFPVVCDQHSTQIGDLRTPHDFDVHCPDGGCVQLWYVHIDSASFLSHHSFCSVM